MIQYLNTDLDLVAPDDLSTLAVDLTAEGVYTLHVARHDDGLWYATFEADEPAEQPEPNIVTLLTRIEALSEAARRTWQACTVREFNIGYECGPEPWAFNQVISAQTLRRLADVGAALRLTLYPSEPANPITP